MNDFFVVTDKGIEPIVVHELNSVIKKKGDIRESCIIFSGELDDAIKFSYFTQSSDRVALLFGEFEFEDYTELLDKSKKIIESIDLKKYFEEGKTFRVVCERRGLHDFNSSIAEQEVGAFFFARGIEQLGFEPKVDIKRSDVIFFLFVNHNKAYLGFDLCGRDLSKRQYRIFTSQGTINAKLAYASVVLSNYKKKEKLIDLYAGAGLIPIEAALSESKTSINFYNKDFIFKRAPFLKDKDWDAFFKKLDSERKDDKLNILGIDPLLRNLEASKKNAKLAGIDKLILFSKMDLDWVDIKLNKSEVDVVVSKIPSITGRFTENLARKDYKELFYQAEFFLKKKGRLCVISENLAVFREMITSDFKIVSEHHLWAGQLEYEFVVLSKE